MRIPCKSCGCMMLSTDETATRYECPNCGRVARTEPMGAISCIKSKRSISDAAVKTYKKGTFDLQIYNRLRNAGYSLAQIAQFMQIDKAMLQDYRNEYDLIGDK